MSSAVTIFGDAKAGQLRIDNLPALNRWLAQLPDGTRLRATFEVTNLSKRARLEKFYRYVLLEQAGEHFGNTRYEQHEQFMQAVYGQPSGMGLSDALGFMTDGSLQEYVMHCVRIAATHGFTMRERP